MTDEILSLNSNNELVAKDPATGNTRPIKVADLSASGDVTVGGSSVITDALAAIDGQQITPAQTGTSTNPTTVVASSVTEDGNNVVTSPNADRDIFVIAKDASDPAAADADDIILEKS
jgi:hypothetical protein